MNSSLSASLIGSFVRWVITIAAARGVALSTDAATEIVMGLVALGPLVWSLLNKKRAEQRIIAEQIANRRVVSKLKK